MKRQTFEEGYKFGHLSVLNEIEPVMVGGKSCRVLRLECICGNVVDKQLKVLKMTTRCCGCTHKNPGTPATVSVGDKFKTNEGYEVEVVNYITACNVTVKFLDSSGAKVKTTVQAIRIGGVSNPYHLSVYGVACYGEPTDDWSHCKKFYGKWTSMLERVHVVEEVDKRASYRGCTIETSWYNFANFYSWAKQQKGALNSRWQLDKDIIVKGNKHYSPDTCCFVPSQINSLFTKREASRGKYPIGVREYTTRTGNRSIKAEVCDPESGKRLSGAGGCTVEECFLWYKSQKECIIEKQADKYKDQIDVRVYQAMYDYEVEITD